MVEIDTLFQTKTAKKPYLWRGTYLYSLYKGLPPVAKNALQIMSPVAYASETNKRRINGTCRALVHVYVFANSA